MENKCIVCKAGSNEVPIIQFVFKGTTYHICTQHIPVLIHKASQLADILPGTENIADS